MKNGMIVNMWIKNTRKLLFPHCSVTQKRKKETEKKEKEIVFQYL